MSNGFTLAARAGAWYWENGLRAVFGDEHVNASPSGTDVLFGVGFEWSPASQWAVGLEFSRYRVDSENLDVLGASARFNW